MKEQITALKDIVNEIGLSEVRKLLADIYQDHTKYIKQFCLLLDINGQYSKRTYEYMEEADLIGRKFIIPVFKPSSRSYHSNPTIFISKLKGYDREIWKRVNLFLEGSIPDFMWSISVETLKVTRKDGEDKYDKYDLRGNGFMGYNPVLRMVGLDKYYQIFGNKMVCIVFTIEFDEDDGYETP